MPRERRISPCVHHVTLRTPFPRPQLGVADAVIVTSLTFVLSIPYLSKTPKGFIEESIAATVKLFPMRFRY